MLHWLFIFLFNQTQVLFLSLSLWLFVSKAFSRCFIPSENTPTHSLEYKPLIRKAGSPCHSLKTPLLMLHMRKTKAFICVHRRLWWWIIYPVAITDTGILLLLLFLFYSLSITAAHQQPCSLQLNTQTAEYISDVVWIWVGAGTCE